MWFYALALVLGGIIGGLLFMAIYNIIPYYVERVPESLMLGASAGVFSIVVGSATLLPNYSFYLLLIGPVRIKYIALFYVLLSFFDVAGSNAGGEIAHMGGAIIGYIYIKKLQNGIDIGQGLINFINLFNNKQVSEVRDEKDTNIFEESSQDEIDKILDKISESGYSSLSKDEKERLFNASKKKWDKFYYLSVFY